MINSAILLTQIDKIINPETAKLLCAPLIWPASFNRAIEKISGGDAATHRDVQRPRQQDGDLQLHRREHQER